MYAALFRLYVSIITQTARRRPRRENVPLAPFTYAMTSPRQGSRLQKTSFGILMCGECHNISSCTPVNGHHRLPKKLTLQKWLKMASAKLALIKLPPQKPNTQKSHDFAPKTGGGVTPPCDIPSGCCSFTGPGQSPVLPFACCVRLLLPVSRCGQCSCWCRFRARGAQ